MIQAQTESVLLFKQGPRLDLILQQLLEQHHLQNHQGVKLMLHQLPDRQWRRQDLQAIYQEITQKPSQFYDMMKWGLYNKLDDCKFILLDLVFIFSCIFIDSGDYSQSEDQLSGVENLNDKSYSFGSLTDSKEKSYADIEYKARINNIISRMEQSQLTELIAFFKYKNKLSQLQALEALHLRNVSVKIKLKLGSALAQNKQFNEAMQMFISHKEQSISISCLIDIMIANCYLERQQKTTEGYSELERAVDYGLSLDLVSSLENCMYFGNKHFSTRNYIKAYHYYNLVWRMFKHRQIAHHLAKTLQHLGQYDAAYEVLIEFKDKDKQSLSIDMAIDLNLLGDIETQRGNIEAGYRFIQQSFKQFHQGYEENRTLLDHLHRQQGCLLTQARPDQNIYKNFYSLAVNLYKDAINSIKRKQEYDNKSQVAINLLQDFKRIVSIEYPEPYMYLTDLYIGRSEYKKAQQNFQQAIRVFKRQQMKIKTHHKLQFLQMATFNLDHILDPQTLAQAQQLNEQANKEIQRSIDCFMKEGIQYFHRGEYSTSIIAFKQVLQIMGNRKISTIHNYVLACYQKLGQFRIGYQYFEKQVQEIYLTENIYHLLQNYCSEDVSLDKLKSFFAKVKFDSKTKGTYLRFIELIIKRKYIQLAKHQLQQVQAKYTQQQSSQDYNQLGLIFCLIDDHAKAIKYFKKGFLSDIMQQKNQYYLTQMLSSLSKFAVSASPQELQDILDGLNFTNIKDSTNLIQFGNILLLRGQADDALQYFFRAFEMNPNEATFLSLINVHGRLGLKDKLTLFTRISIEKLKFQNENKGNKTKLLKQLVVEAKKLVEFESQKFQPQQQANISTIKEQYFIWLKQLVRLILLHGRLMSDRFVVDLIGLYLKRQDFNQALQLIKLLLQKYPRYSAFLKIKEYCSAAHHQPLLCQKCILHLNPTNKLLSQLFLITEIDSYSESIRRFGVLYDRLKEKAKDNDLCSLLTNAEGKQKGKAPLLAVFRAMITLLNDKNLPEAESKKQTHTGDRKEVLSQQFKAGVQMFLKRCQAVSEQNKKSLFTILCNSLRNPEKAAYLMEK